MTEDYRRDYRSEDKFKEDIQKAHATEKRLMTAYVDWLNHTKGKENPYSFRDNGVDNSGKFIKDDKKVNTSADFILLRKGFPDRKIEIKSSKKNNKDFHLKAYQVKSYIKNDVCVVNFMGSETDFPKFCILTPSELEETIEKKTPVKQWGKECFRFSENEVRWICLDGPIK